ncbi:MAG: pSer/pThr/pTyr-binding forkhead associated (FHA) protein, partial [Pseudoalteromonas tetraodonis]
MKNYSLIVSVPDAESTLFELRGDRIGVGRELDNQIQIKINEVSSSHCEFRKLDDGGYEVVDLDSTNGTRVNGKQIEKHTLVDGDRLLLGEMVPAHFVELAEGEKPADVAVEAGEGGKKAAAAYTQMDEKLQSIEADIAVKASELEAMQKEHEAKKAQYEKMAASLAALEAEIEAKKAG